MKILFSFLPVLLLLSSQVALGQSPKKDYDGYLFVYFTGNSIEDEQIHYALSKDGYSFIALNDGRPILNSKLISSTGGVRDPHILRTQDGKTFYMVATDMVSANGWDSNRAMVLLKSNDLVNWEHSVINIPKKYPHQNDLKRVWAPQTIYDPVADKYMIYWSMKYGDGPDIIYYAYANDDFTDIIGEPKTLFIPKDKKSCIDGDIVFKDGTFHLFYKTEGHGNGIKSATTDNLTSGKWIEQSGYKQQTADAVEGAGVFKVIGKDEYILMYDVYMNGRYDFAESKDLVNFKKTDKKVNMNFHPRHGTVIPITNDEYIRLLNSYSSTLNDGRATVLSPDRNLKLQVSTDADGTPVYSIDYKNKRIMMPSPLGLISSYYNYSTGLHIENAVTHPFEKEYSQNHIKRSAIQAKGNRLICTFADSSGKKVMDIEFVVKNKDIAFRYLLPKIGEPSSVRILDEKTSFNFPENTTTFLTPQSDPMIGWKRTKPSYEEEYRLDRPMSEKSQYGRGYTFPALFKVGNDGWALISETGVDSRYCGSRLSDFNGKGYEVEFPMPEENNGNGTIEPAFAIPGATPWRTISIGESLAPIVESTIYWDVVEPLYSPSIDYKSGRGTWSWIVWQDASINVEDIKRFIDLASEMGYEYTLIDNYWDTNIGKENMSKLIDYSRQKGVEPILWYSSSGYWNDIVQGPTNRMDNPIIRKEEMKWLKANGVKGIKVDFFGGDKQETMRLYEAILSDANDYGLMVIFHGCTLPRGWERMYPNYVGSEAVLASENIYFQQHFCDQEAVNATTHPFIRNAVGSMEFGGTFLNKCLNRGNDGGNIRRTSDVFQIATAILFQNPIQNFAITPNNLTDAPKECIDFLRNVPTEWDETRFIDGYPGKYVVMARRSRDRWFLAGVNATDVTLELDIDLPGYTGGDVEVYSDNVSRQALKEIKNNRKKGIERKTSATDFVVNRSSVSPNNGKLHLSILSNGGVLVNYKN